MAVREHGPLPEPMVRAHAGPSPLTGTTLTGIAAGMASALAHESGHDAQTAAAPPVGLCYDSAVPGFGTDYSGCT